MPGWIEPTVLVLPYLAGGLGGLLLVRAAPALALDAAPLWGLACGAVSGVLLGLLAAVSGGPLGDGRLSAVGPSAWQTGAVSALEIGISAAVTAGIANYLVLRRTGTLTRPAAAAVAAARVVAQHAAARSAAARSAAARSATGQPGDAAAPADDPAAAAHVIYVDPWAGDPPSQRRGPSGPSALP